jgi:hypothetical protein
VDQGLARLLQRDPFAHGNIQGQIQEAKGRGLGFSQYREPQDYRCPLDYAPDDEPDPPWLGELKASGIKRVEWRLYFGEPINYQDHVVGITLRDSKLGRLTTIQNQARQKSHIKQAMRFLKTYFTLHGYHWAPFA